ncbi:MAG: hypothetical protein MZV64_39655 [Ignavibacteriales bacterium]|nr:hypothetical protein [Ignavibacteriales bacterium]
MGRKDIEDDKKDPTKDATDAMYFMIIGKFPVMILLSKIKMWLHQQQHALAGSLIGGVLNQYFDDYVKGFQLRQTGTGYKI